jgi:uncharacterized protein (TIGR03086 family)
MDLDLLDLYEQASGWTLSRVAGAADQLDTPTRCDGWDVRTLLNHMLETGTYFLSSATGGDAPPPSPTPAEVLGADPARDFEGVRSETLKAYAESGVIDKTGPLLGIAFTEQLLHGWDLAQATGQDPSMPAELPAAAYEVIYGRFTPEQRQGVFKPEIEVGPNASPEDRLLAYTGRDPSS